MKPAKLLRQIAMLDVNALDEAKVIERQLPGRLVGALKKFFGGARGCAVADSRSVKKRRV